MLLPDKVYDVLKWVTLIGLPAAGALYFGLAKVWSFPLAEEIVGSITVLCAFLGALLGVSTHKYNQDQ